MEVATEALGTNGIALEVYAGLTVNPEQTQPLTGK